MSLVIERMLPLLEQPPGDLRARTIERLHALPWLTDADAHELAAVHVVWARGADAGDTPASARADDQCH